MLRHRHGLPDGWRSIVETTCAVWPPLDADEQDRVAEAADWLLRHKHWEASGGYALTDEITVTVAVQAGLLVLGLDVGELREVSAIVVYPTAMQSAGVWAGPVAGTVTDAVIPVLGEAHDRRGRVPLARWVEVCTEVYDALRTGVVRPPLRDYAATNVGEFFAVATECFVDTPRALRTHEPDLYGILAVYYGQDPAARLDRAGVPSAEPPR